MYGAIFLAVEPHVQVGVLNAGGRSAHHAHAELQLPARASGRFSPRASPSLINAPGVTHLDEVPVAPSPPQYHENLPLRDGEPLLVQLADSTTSHHPVTGASTPLTGAMDIQQYLDRSEWVTQSANPVAYAPYLRQASALAGSRSASSCSSRRAIGRCRIRRPRRWCAPAVSRIEQRCTVTIWRSPRIPALPTDPHGFMPLPNLFGAIARGAQEQIAVFFESDGAVDDPSRAEPLLRSADRRASAGGAQLRSVTSPIAALHRGEPRPARVSLRRQAIVCRIAW